MCLRNACASPFDMKEDNASILEENRPIDRIPDEIKIENENIRLKVDLCF